MSKSVKLGLGAAVVAAAYIGATWYVGGKVQTEVQKQEQVVQEFLETNPSVAVFDRARRFTISQYERGVFSSKVQYELELADQENELVLKFEDTIYHGPWPVAAGHWSPALAVAKGRLLETESIQEWFDATSDKSPYQGTTVFDFGGHIHGKGQFAAAQFQDPETQEQLQLEAIDLRYDHHRDSGKTQLDLHLPKLTLSEPSQYSVVLEQLSLQASATDHSLVAHQSALQLDSLQIQSPETGLIDLKGVKATMDSQQTNELMSGKVHYEVQQILAEGIEWGRLDLDMSVKNIHQGLINDIGLLADSDEPEDELQLQQLIGQFLSYDPEVEQAKLSWANSQGSSFIEARLKAAPALVEFFTQGTELRDELGQVYDTLYLDISLSRPMLQQLVGQDNLMAAMFDMMFDSAVEIGTELGLVTYDNAQVRLKFEFDAEQNILLLNNQPITEDELLQLFLAMQMGGLF